jgi:uncharacterized protein YegP (UPF0339 family)
MTFYALALKETGNGSTIVESLRTCGYSSKESAAHALDRSSFIGYVKEYGKGKPVYYKATTKSLKND